jgi:hypothetical protein
MIFINNKYTVTYYKIINRAISRKLQSYKERHHIIPKSLGGPNTKDNIVELTAKEHFICHLLLTKMVMDTFKKKMSYAVWLMCNVKNQNQSNRYIPNGNTYSKIREVHAKVVSSSLQGIKKTYSSFAGKTHTKETLQLQRELKLGKNNPNFGITQKSEWNQAKSDSQKGKAKPLIHCNHCNKDIGGHGNYIRWHGNNCKLNNIL